VKTVFKARKTVIRLFFILFVKSFFCSAPFWLLRLSGYVTALQKLSDYYLNYYYYYYSSLDRPKSSVHNENKNKDVYTSECFNNIIIIIIIIIISRFAHMPPPPHPPSSEILQRHHSLLLYSRPTYRYRRPAVRRRRPAAAHEHNLIRELLSRTLASIYQ